jgi:hypothetical protein
MLHIAPQDEVDLKYASYPAGTQLYHRLILRSRAEHGVSKDEAATEDSHPQTLLYPIFSSATFLA